MRNREELASLGEPVERDVALRREWHDLQEERSRLIEGQCEQLTELSDGLIKGALRRSVTTKPLQEALRAAVRGTNLRRDKIERFMARIAESKDPLAKWQEAMAELDARVAESAEPARKLPPLKSMLDFFGTEEVSKMVEKVSAEQVLDLSLMALGDQPVFEYRTKEGEYIEFADASAGQQATALLRVLLNQGGPPLIIDQPEDDLDSQVILEVVDQIREAKHGRQLIFSSHNANLVVNGDAELVVCCDYRKAGDHSGGKIKYEGAIDIPKVRDEITVVMEGGEKAFRLRKDKYGF